MDKMKKSNRMNTLYRMNLINIFNFLASLREEEKDGQGFRMIRSCSIMWAKSLGSVFDDYMTIVEERSKIRK